MSLNMNTMRTLSDTVGLAKQMSDQNFDQALAYRTHQAALKTLKYFLLLNPPPAREHQTAAEREMYGKIEQQMTYYVGDLG